MIKIVCVGTIKEKFTVALIDEYVKRLRTPYQLSIIEVKESKYKSNPQLCIDDESDMLLKQIYPTDFVVLLDIWGTIGSTQDFHKVIEASFNQSKHCVFVIGGSLGVNQSLKKRANVRLSISRMTFPHQIVRALLIEQIYRSYTLYHNIPYDK